MRHDMYDDLPPDENEHYLHGEPDGFSSVMFVFSALALTAILAAAIFIKWWWF